MRVGLGFDVHAFAEGRKLVLGGVEIPYKKGLEGHSDADVVLHAVMDALLGALALGDIGHHFPNTDERYRNADSKLLCRHVFELVCQRGYEIGNMDVMIMAEKPKVSPYTLAMRESMAQLFGCELGAVSVKATTMEGMGFVGRQEGIAAHAVVLLVPKRKETE
jgi:2-C-methyl-D-erythritol 2,4-cyclodiphosphate synthase